MRIARRSIGQLSGAMLPNEVKTRTGIRTHLSKQLTFSRDALEQAIDVVPFQEQYPIDGHVYIAALGLHIRACRKFQQVIRLVEDGQADGADALSRTLFELFLGQAFICRQSVKIRRPKPLSASSFANNKLSRPFRAKLYLAHDIIQSEEKQRKLASVSGYKRRARAALNEMRPMLASTKQVIGPEWAERLKANTPAGSVYVMAECLGKQAMRWYRIIYADQSNQVHPSDPNRFAWYDHSGEPHYRWQDEDNRVAGALWAANGAFGLAVNEVGRLLDKSHPRYARSGVFEHRYAEMKRAFGRN